MSFPRPDCTSGQDWQSERVRTNHVGDDAARVDHHLASENFSARQVAGRDRDPHEARSDVLRKDEKHLRIVDESAGFTVDHRSIRLEQVLGLAHHESHEEFGRQFKDEISVLTRNLTVYVSSNDRALLMSRILNRERRLGESTVDSTNPDQFEEAARLFELVEPDEGYKISEMFIATFCELLDLDFQVVQLVPTTNLPTKTLKAN